MKHYILILLAISNISCIQAEDVIKLGVLAPLSGDFASYGEEIRRGTDLAVKDLGSNGIKVEVVYENACLPIEYKTALNKLTSIDKIHAISHSYCVIGMLPSMDFLEEKKIVSFQSGAIKEILDPKEYLFSLSPKTGKEGSALAEALSNNEDIKDVAVLYLETQWGIEYRDSFKAEWERNNRNISLLSSSKIGETDFRSQALTIRKHNPGAVVLVHLGGMLGTALKQIRDMGYEGKIYSTSDSDDKNMFTSARGSEKGLMYLSTDSSTKTDAEKTFEKIYQDNFKDQPTSLSKNAYDSALLLTNALSECKLNSTCAKEKLYRIKNHQGASGVFTIEADGGVIREMNEKELH